ncbi:MAG: argininosuccinate lyase [Candidatus Omnitrophica bacterium]|nr:argininosuccinate lyase [Candidatus Omnitrophota bacterium]
MAKKLWGGRFSKKTDPLVEKFTSSIDVDKELALYDVIGSIFHAAVLKEAGLISQKEYSKINKGLKEIRQSIVSGNFKIDVNSEDIHSDIQNKLERKAGSAALKLHTARSRNDQIVFDIKFYCKEACINVCDLIEKLVKSISYFAEKYKNINIPGYTHLQHAQPISLVNYFSAYNEMLFRDSERILALNNKIKISLGSGALAGTVIDASKYNKAIKKACKKLGNALGIKLNVASVDNSIDNVSDRDFVIEALNTLAIIGMHLSRLAEDLIIWSTAEFGFIELDDAFCTGSSLMPQKKNPDVLELIRGNTGKLYGNLTSALVMMKGLPLSYNRDMQLDKEPLFSSFKIVKVELVILSKLIPKIKINKEKINKQLQDESLYATDLAHYLVTKGVSFSQAHKIMGNLVRFSLDKKIKIKEMTDEQLKKFTKYLNQNIIKKLMDPVYSVKSKKSIKAKR